MCPVAYMVNISTSNQYIPAHTQQIHNYIESTSMHKHRHIAKLLLHNVISMDLKWQLVVMISISRPINDVWHSKAIIMIVSWKGALLWLLIKTEYWTQTVMQSICIMMVIST